MCSFEKLSFIFKARASEEFSHDAGGRNFLVITRDEVVDELKQAMRLRIFWAILWHCREDKLGIRSQYGKLDIKRRVEHHVGILLIRRNPFLL